LDAELFAENIKNQSFGSEQVNKKIKIMKKNKIKDIGLARVSRGTTD
jgi:hypothetical protein